MSCALCSIPTRNRIEIELPPVGAAVHARSLTLCWNCATYDTIARLRRGASLAAPLGPDRN